MGTEGSNLASSSGESCRRSANASTTSQCAALSGASRNHERRHRPTSAFGRQERRYELRTLAESWRPGHKRDQVCLDGRVFVDFLAARFAGKPEWDRWHPRSLTPSGHRGHAYG
jgi:hypothetical protein